MVVFGLNRLFLYFPFVWGFICLLMGICGKLFKTAPLGMIWPPPSLEKKTISYDICLFYTHSIFFFYLEAYIFYSRGSVLRGRGGGGIYHCDKFIRRKFETRRKIFGDELSRGIFNGGFIVYTVNNSLVLCKRNN